MNILSGNNRSGKNGTRSGATGFDSDIVKGNDQFTVIARRQQDFVPGFDDSGHTDFNFADGTEIIARRVSIMFAPIFFFDVSQGRNIFGIIAVDRCAAGTPNIVFGLQGSDTSYAETVGDPASGGETSLDVDTVFAVSYAVIHTVVGKFTHVETQSETGSGGLTVHGTAVADEIAVIFGTAPSCDIAP